MKRKFRVLLVFIFVILVSTNLLACTWNETKEKLQESSDKFEKAVEKNEPGNKLINGVLGGEK